ncbi:sigma-70 family RNA polymerase sigma factor [Schinkia azotoformans]|uniref:sigma-70 family RNA polymerase sigma factor n=1 Tax=Schinkia azotoformans TaxID=1454 RepID=UPI002E1A3CCE|nr:sigma-70 family RNA polymerase sigma factor [Schinkia azotoformans]
MLTNEELIQRAHDGCQEAKDEFFDRNYRFIHFIARKYLNLPIEYDDLISICSIGMMEAFNKFSNNGCKFTTFAAAVMKYKILKYLEYMERVGKLRTISMETAVTNDGRCRLGDFISNQEDQYKDIDDRLFLEELLMQYEKKTKTREPYRSQMIESQLKGEKQSDAARRLGISQAHASRKYREAVADLKMMASR